MLSAIMIGGQTGAESPVDQVADLLQADDFYSERHRQIYTAVIELRSAGQAVDVVQVGTWLKDRQRIAQVGGMGYLTEVLNAAPAIANVRGYAKTVVSKARVRRLIRVCQRAEAVGYTDYGDVDQFISGVESEVRDLALSSSEKSGEMIETAVKRVMTEIASAATRQNHMIGVPTGFDGLDARMHGLREGTVTIIAARPGMGKSALALNMAINIARDSGNYVPFFSLEMSNDEQAMRAISSDASIPLGVLTSANTDSETMNRMVVTAGAMRGLKVVLYDESNLTTQGLSGRVRRLVANAARAGKKVAAVFVDYLQLMKSFRRTNSREQEVADVSRGLKLLAKELKIPFVVLAQLNREGEKGSKPERPKLSHLRESGSIEQDADVVIFVHREAYYNEKNKPSDEDVAELIIAKGRNIQRGTTKVRFNGMYTRFSREEVSDER